jgi:hypothetical protein
MEEENTNTRNKERDQKKRRKYAWNKIEHKEEGTKNKVPFNSMTLLKCVLQ